MLKGVNKRIVEINHTGNEYFDKAILFVKPEMEGMPRSKLKVHAKSYIRSFGENKKRLSVPMLLLLILVIMTVGAAATALIFLI